MVVWAGREVILAEDLGWGWGALWVWWFCESEDGRCAMGKDVSAERGVLLGVWVYSLDGFWWVEALAFDVMEFESMLDAEMRRAERLSIRWDTKTLALRPSILKSNGHHAFK